MQQIDFTTATTFKSFCELLMPQMPPQFRNPISDATFIDDEDAFTNANCALNCYTVALREANGYTPLPTFEPNLLAAKKLFELLEPVNARRERKLHVDTDADQMMWSSPWGHVCETPEEYALICAAFDFETDESTIDFDDTEVHANLEAAVLKFIDGVRDQITNRGLEEFLDFVKCRTPYSETNVQSLPPMLAALHAPLCAI